VRVHSRSLPAVVFIAALTQAAWAQTVHEGFKLTFPVYNTGTGFSGAWQQGGFNVSGAGYTAGEKSLAFAGLATTPGRVSGHAFPAINGAIRNLAQPLGAPNTTAYVSFLIRPQGTLDDGVFNGFFGVTVNGSTGQELFVGKPGAGAQQEYVIENRGGAGQLSSGTATVVGQTVFLVVKAEFLAGNDIFTLYTNPLPGAPEPLAGLVKADLDLGVVPRVGLYSTGAFDVDEIRIGATYADVTPASPFAGTAGASNCHGKSVSALTQEHGGLPNAAAALGFPTVTALHHAITGYCGN
jgi:hypothetical protein